MIDNILSFLRQYYIDSFEYPYLLFFILIIPLFILLMCKRPDLIFRRLALPATMLDIKNPTFSSYRYPLGLIRSPRFWFSLVGAILFAGGFICLTIAIAHPYGGSNSTTNSEGIDIYFALDMSASMKAYDYSLDEMRDRYSKNIYTQNRFDTARSTILDFVQERSERCHDRSKTLPRCDRVGITLFAQSAFIATPLTTHYEMLSEQLKKRKIDDINASQSAIGDGILRAVASMRYSPSSSKSIILITDGDRRGGRISINQAVAAANQYNIHIFPILIGKSNRAVLAHTDVGGTVNFHEADFPVNFELLESIAKQTDAEAWRATSDQQFKKQLDEILMTLEPSIDKDSRRENQIDLSLNYVALALGLGIVACCSFLALSRQYP